MNEIDFHYGDADTSEVRVHGVIEIVGLGGVDKTDPAFNNLVHGQVIHCPIESRSKLARNHP